MQKYRIGVFDSGVGGLTVLHACVRALPGAAFLYLGDNARAPYGSRPREEVAAFTREALGVFLACGVDAAVLACNTATAACIGEMRGEFPFPVIGTEPAVLPAARAAKTVLVLCTPHTARSARLSGLLARCPRTDFTVAALPRLAAAVEGSFRGVPLDLAAHLPRGNYGAVVLGCTHYAFLKEEISAFFHAPVFDGAEGVARRVASLLGEGERVGAGFFDHFCKEINTNKSSQKMTDFDIDFLGKWGNFNKLVYKQTFISKRLS